MDGAVTISMGSILAFVGFLFQLGLTIGAIAFSHGGLNQRVRSIEQRFNEQADLNTVVAKLEAELEAVGREIKNLRDDFRRVLDEFTRARVR